MKNAIIPLVLVFLLFFALAYGGLKILKVITAAKESETAAIVKCSKAGGKYIQGYGYQDNFCVRVDAIIFRNQGDVHAY